MCKKNHHSIVDWIAIRKYKIVFVVLLIWVIIATNGCIQNYSRLNLFYEQIELRNANSIIGIAESFMHDGNHDILTMHLGGLQAFSHLISHSGLQGNSYFADHIEWRTFVRLMMLFENNDFFNALTQEERLYIADALIELQSYWPIQYKAFYDRLGNFILELHLEFHNTELRN